MYLIDGDTVKPFITDGKVGGFIWEDDEHILFAANRSDAEKKRRESGDMFTAYYRISVKGGEALPAFTLPFTALSIDKISDELFTACFCLNPFFGGKNLRMNRQVRRGGKIPGTASAAEDAAAVV